MTENEKKGVVAIANGAIDALKGTPALIVVLIINIFVVGGFGYVELVRTSRNSELISKVIDRCVPIQNKDH